MQVVGVYNTKHVKFIMILEPLGATEVRPVYWYGWYVPFNKGTSTTQAGAVIPVTWIFPAYKFQTEYKKIRKSAIWLTLFLNDNCAS